VSAIVSRRELEHREFEAAQHAACFAWREGLDQVRRLRAAVTSVA
jgi:hypothetical protein